MKEYEVIVLGWGKAGKTLAGKFAKAGKKVAMIEESGKMYGGTCINIGCLPTKSLQASAKTLAKSREYGVQTDEWRFFRQAIKKKNAMVEKLRSLNYAALADLDNVDVYKGRGRFVSDHVIAVGEEELSAPKIFINTGGKSRRLEFPGSNLPEVLDSTGILNLDSLPKRLAIIGTGFIGLEFASLFANFGTEVSILQFDGNFLPTEDEEAAKAIRESLEEQGVKFYFHSSIHSVEKHKEGGLEMTYLCGTCEKEVQELRVDYILLAVGREPNTADLGLENTGIELGNRKEILVNEYLESKVPGVYALGDVKGGPQFTSISFDDHRIILGEKTLKDRSYFPWVAFLDTPYARIGHNKKSAEAAGIAFTKAFLPAAKIPKAHVIGELRGFLEVLFNEKEEIIGATLFHAEAQELINILALAMQEKIKKDKLANMLYAHPVMTEAFYDLFA